MDIFIPYLHYLGIMTLTGSLMALYVLVTSGLCKTRMELISKMNLLYWISLILLMITGLIRWFMIGKHAIYYNGNPWFHIKLTLFVIVLIYAAIASVRIGKWKVLVNMGRVHDISRKDRVKFLWLLRIQFILVIIIVFLAVLVTNQT